MVEHTVAGQVYFIVDKPLTQQDRACHKMARMKRITARNILDDLGTEKDKRNGFFIVDIKHTIEELCFADGTPSHLQIST